MRLATNEEAMEACLTRSATEASRFLASHGLIASSSRCNVFIARLIEQGERPKMSKANVTPAIFEQNEAAMAKGCRDLLRRMLATGHHFISDPADMADALREAGMIPDAIAA